MRSAELTLPGFTHDICSAIHPLAAASPFFRDLNLDEYGLEWIYPPASVAHPFEDGSAALLYRSIEAASEILGADGERYSRLMKALTGMWDAVIPDVLGPLRIPRHPFASLRFGWRAALPATTFARTWFRGERARGLFAGMAAHSIAPLEHWMTAAFGLTMGAAGHAVGWPVAKGGSQELADALARCFVANGGTIETGVPVNSINSLPKGRAVLFDVGPSQLARICGHSLPSGYRKILKSHRYGPGVWKVDWAVDGPIPWKAKECLLAGTVHVGGTIGEIAAAERDVWEGRHPEEPFVILAQQSPFDDSRAPKDKHTVWAYCHVPNGSDIDMTERIEARIEGFAPGFRERILARHSMSPIEMEEYNPNYIGGDIAGGANNFWRLFVRPLGRWKPYVTPIKGVYLCSASMPPGGGVHGMCGYFAAQAVLRDWF
jgi:phytoene dehydrogenase-like protein